jgi:hypothetical protein
MRSGLPRHPSSNVDPPRARPIPTSIVGEPGEVNRQKVACFFPVASHSWLGASEWYYLFPWSIIQPSLLLA